MTERTSPHANTAVVDGFGPDAVACARLLRDDGHDVTMVGQGVSEEALALQPRGVTICDGPTAGRDATGAILVVDCWMAETDPLVRRHRAAGAHVTSIGDMILQRTRARTLGVTGSGGKTTATRTAVDMMRAGGCTVTASTSARAGNAWPTAELVEDVLGPEPDSWLALELTSTHLAYMHTSPNVAAITAWWPDHVELHGSVARYRDAKATILRHQRPDDICVLNADDAGAVSFAQLALGRVLEASGERAVDTGVGVEHGHVTFRLDGAAIRLCRRDQIPLAPPLFAVALTAACAALACGAEPDGVAERLANPVPLAFRGQAHAQSDGVTMVDASAATTPRKTLGALSGFDPRHVVLLVGGDGDVGGVPVHTSPEEHAELERVMGTLTRCRATIAFGAAAARIDATLTVATLSDAVAAARAMARRGETILLAPMFPLSMEERAIFAALAADGSTTVTL